MIGLEILLHSFFGTVLEGPGVRTGRPGDQARLEDDKNFREGMP
jgi:hypothetical protein